MNTIAVPLMPAGLTISQWHPADSALGTEARAFCLDTIKGTYGYDYRPDWHADLDSLTQGEDSWYAPQNRGVMLVIKNAEGAVVGTGGVYNLGYKKNLIGQFGDRYGDINQISTLVRTYLSPAYRGNQLSRMLVPMLELAAIRYGYTHVNLHCEASATNLRRHWASFGFTNFLNDDSTSHYDKLVCNCESLAAAPVAQAA